MVGTHADSLVAEAVLKGIDGFDLDLAYAAVYKDATVPPVDDDKISFVAQSASFIFFSTLTFKQVRGPRDGRWLRSPRRSEHCIC